MSDKESNARDTQRSEHSAVLNNLISLAFLMLVLIGLSFALFSGAIKEPVNSSIKTPSAIIENITQLPPSTPVPVVVDAPTGVIVYSRIRSDRFSFLNHQINAGDTILWDNFDFDRSHRYTLVELNGKIDNITLPLGKRATYVFNTTGNYTFSLRYAQLRGKPSIQNISVVVDKNSTNSTS